MPLLFEYYVACVKKQTLCSLLQFKLAAIFCVNLTSQNDSKEQGTRSCKHLGILGQYYSVVDLECQLKGCIFIYSGSAQQISFEINLISKEISQAEPEYMNMHPLN